MSHDADVVLKLIGDSQDSRRRPQIEKFIRCNGAGGVIKAANAVARRRAKDASAIGDPWAYCIRVYNGNAARSAALHPVLYVLENALRSRVNALLTEGDREWYRDPGAYLDPDSAGRVSGGDDYAQVQDRTAGGDAPYPIQRFRSGVTFVERIPFSGLQRIIDHNHPFGALSDLFTPLENGTPLDPGHVKSSLAKLASSRNDVAHHRPITPEHFSLASRHALELLDHLEFDTVRAFERIYVAIEEERRRPGDS